MLVEDPARPEVRAAKARPLGLADADGGIAQERLDRREDTQRDARLQPPATTCA